MSATKFPWDKMDNEPSVWFERFDRFYRPLTPDIRTLTAAYRECYYETHNEYPTRPGYSADWGKKAHEWQWKDRAEAWDMEMHQERIERERKNNVDMNKRHIEAGQAVQTLALDRLLKAGISDASTALRALRLGVSVERAARGIPSHIAEISDMDEDEIEREIAKRLAAAGITGALSPEDSSIESETEGRITSESDEGRKPEPDDRVSGSGYSSREEISEESG